MKISVVTPTADQPFGIALLERYMRRQTMSPDEWIVADDGEVKATLTMGQRHVCRPRTHEGGASLAANMLAALEVVSGDVIIIMEHDDWYAPSHIAQCLVGLDGSCITGSKWQRYYHVPSRQWMKLHNIGSALCNTAFRRRNLEIAQSACDDALRRNKQQNFFGIDRLLWEAIPKHKQCITDSGTVVGVKGLPGRAGLGVGHRPDNRRPWKPDPDGKKLVEWVGGDARHYLGLESAA